MANKCVRLNTDTGVFEWYDYPTGGAGAWGDITGTLSDQTDLQGELDAKEDTGVAASEVADHEAAADPHPAYALASELSTHEAAADPHTAYQRESEKGSANGYAGLSASSKLTGSQQTYGTGANTACEGNDTRLSDARTPVAHNHDAGDINAGTVATARLGSGTANSSTYLRGDQTWATPSGGAAAWGDITGTLSAQTDLQSALDAKQATLVSATNIKTVNGVTLLGSGNLAVSSVTAGVGTSPTSSSTQQITHNLGRTPVVIRIHGKDTFLANAAALPPTGSTGLWCSTGNLCVYQPYDAATITAAEPAATSAAYAIRQQTGVGNFATGVIGNVGATTFDIVWTETGTHTAQVYLWEAS